MGDACILVGLPRSFALLDHQPLLSQQFCRTINTGIVIWYLGYLFIGFNDSVTMYFIVGFFAQWWLRKNRPEYFVKYNYIVSAALDGGTQVMVFILTFAVFGGSGKARPFP